MNAQSCKATQLAIKWMGTNALLSKSESLSVCFTLVAFDNCAVGSQLKVVQLQWINICRLSHQVPLLLCQVPSKKTVIIKSPLQQFLVQRHGDGISGSVSGITFLPSISVFPFVTFAKQFNSLCCFAVFTPHITALQCFLMSSSNLQFPSGNVLIPPRKCKQ